MARTTNNKLRLDRLAEDSEELKEILSAIMEKESFLDLFVEDPETSIQKKRRLSRNMLQHLDTLVECDHIELIYEDPSSGMVAFLVEKKNGLGRFIVNCRPLNKVQKKPENMGLPPIREVINSILSWSFAAQCDGTTFFCQFELCKEIREYFPIRLADMRGKIVNAVLKRMPMGWSHAPRIAQAVANFIMRDIGIGWVDNFVFGGVTKKEFNEKRALLRERLDYYNIQVDDLELEATTRLTALGLEFCLKSHRYRLEPKWQ